MQAFNEFHQGGFLFAQLQFVSKTLMMKEARKVCILDRSGYTPGRDHTGFRQSRAVLTKGSCPF